MTIKVRANDRSNLFYSFVAPPAPQSVIPAKGAAMIGYFELKRRQD